MVTKEVIDTLYKKYSKPPKSPQELNLALLFDYAFENHGIIIDENDLYITSIDPSSPFACIPLDRICEIVEFAEVIAIVLPAAIIFLNKKNSDVNIHLRMTKPSLWDRMKMAIMREDEDDHEALFNNGE
ncbi:MAG: hypothetical protein NC098_01945 [Lachnoclostridium sp.]|nr:hypothetical protein [Lachnoclostridium sp.]